MQQATFAVSADLLCGSLHIIQISINKLLSFVSNFCARFEVTPLIETRASFIVYFEVPIRCRP